MPILMFAGGDSTLSREKVNNPLGTGDIHMDRVGMPIGSQQGVRVDISTIVTAIQGVINAFTINDPMGAIQGIRAMLSDPLTGSHPALLQISDSIQRELAVIETLSGDPATAIQANELEILENNVVQSLQGVLGLIGDQAVQIQSDTWDIYLDSGSIKNKLTAVNISYNEDSVHNYFEGYSIDQTLFRDANPKINQGDLRITVHIGSRVLYFLLEERSGDEVDFKLFGRSGSAREDYPHAQIIDVTLDAPDTARNIVEDNLSVSAADWEIGNWMIPETFEFEGTPIELAQAIAEIGGGIVRCNDDGSLKIRRKYPIRPIDMATNGADVDYDRLTDIIRIDHDQEKGAGYDGVAVYGYTPEIVEPIIEVKEKEDGTTTYSQGEDVEVKIYWGAFKPADEGGESVVSTFLTDGLATLMAPDQTEPKGEDPDDPLYVVFEEGVATTSHPISELSNYDWIGADGGLVTFKEGYSDLQMDGENKYAIAQLSYLTKYDLYRLQGHLVPLLLKVVKQPAVSDIAVSIVIDPALNNPASDIIDNNITTEEIAKDRAEAFLDSERYDVQRVSLRTPYKAEAIDGILAYVNDANIGVNGNYHITGVTIQFNGPQIISEVEVEKCLLSQS